MYLSRRRLRLICIDATRNRSCRGQTSRSYHFGFDDAAAKWVFGLGTSSPVLRYTHPVIMMTGIAGERHREYAQMLGATPIPVSRLRWDDCQAALTTCSTANLKTANRKEEQGTARKSANEVNQRLNSSVGSTGCCTIKTSDCTRPPLRTTTAIRGILRLFGTMRPPPTRSTNVEAQTLGKHTNVTCLYRVFQTGPNGLPFHFRA